MKGLIQYILSAVSQANFVIEKVPIERICKFIVREDL